MPMRRRLRELSSPGEREFECVNCRRGIRESQEMYNTILDKYCCIECMGDLAMEHIEEEFEYVEPLLADVEEFLDEEEVYERYISKYVEEVS